MNPNYLPTDYQSFIYLGHYSRWIEEKKRREYWSETVERYITFFQKHLKENFGINLDTDIWNKLNHYIYTLQVMPSMRALWTAGPALERDNAAGYNCSFMPIDNIRAWDELCYLSMCGVGVGYSVERQYINNLPSVPEILHPTETVISVRDSRIGWSVAIKELISLLYSGLIPSWDLRKLRPAGARLKTFGGRSAGPGPLHKALCNIVKIFQGARGRKLNSLECHDICCFIAEAVVSGGDRRSAMISYSNLSDLRMRAAKSGDWREGNKQRELANNSVAYTEKPDIGIFMEEWKALHDSKSGERGIFNRDGAIRKIKNIGRRDANWTFSGNPCLTYETPIITSEGIIYLGKWAEEKTLRKVWDGNKWVRAKAVSTGSKLVYKITLSNRMTLRGTEDHRIGMPNGEEITIGTCLGEQIDFLIPKWTEEEVGNIDPRMVAVGFMQGDGTYHKASQRWKYVYFAERDEEIKKFFENLDIKLEEQKANNSMYGIDKKFSEYCSYYLFPTPLPERHLTTNVLQLSPGKARSFLRGLFSANGCVLKKYGRVTLKSSCESLIRDVQIMLTLFGIRSYYTTNKSHPVRFNNGTYVCKESYDLNISSSDIVLFEKYIGFIHSYKNDALKDISKIKEIDKRKSLFVVSLEEDGEEEVFDFSMEETHWASAGGIRVHNCQEILLRPYEFCNLTQITAVPDDNKQSFIEKVEIAAILGTFQSTLTNFRYLHPQWGKNCEEERLLGNGITGICDNSLTFNATLNFLNNLKEKTIQVNKEWAEKLGINPSVATTCIKPAGNSSELLGTSSGIHPHYAKYYMRGIQMSKYNPLSQLMIDEGIPYEPYIGKENSTVIFYFPKKAPDYTVTRREMTALQQLELVQRYNKYYTEHMVSCTIYVRDHEWLDVGAYVYRNFDDITGLSFLPYSEESHGYTQLPYREIGEEEYKKAMEKMPSSICWEKLREYEQEDNTEGSRELSCSAGVCEIQ